MITDALLRLSTDQAVTASAVSTNTIDLSQARDIGEGKPLYMVFTITETFATLTSLAFNIVTDDNASLGSPAVINTVSVTLASGGLAAGKQLVVVQNLYVQGFAGGGGHGVLDLGQVAVYAKITHQSVYALQQEAVVDHGIGLQGGLDPRFV